MDGPLKRSLDDGKEGEPATKREKIEEISKDGTKEHQEKRIARPSRKDKNGRSAGRRRGTRPEGEDADGGEAREKKTRLPKRACALLIGFSGTGYYGMQVYVFIRSIVYIPSNV